MRWYCLCSCQSARIKSCAIRFPQFLLFVFLKLEILISQYTTTMTVSVWLFFRWICILGWDRGRNYGGFSRKATFSPLSDTKSTRAPHSEAGVRCFYLEGSWWMDSYLLWLNSVPEYSSYSIIALGCGFKIQINDSMLLISFSDKERESSRTGKGASAQELSHLYNISICFKDIFLQPSEDTDYSYDFCSKVTKDKPASI